RGDRRGCTDAAAPAWSRRRAGRGRRPARADPRRRLRGDARRQLVAAEDVPAVRLGVLRLLAQPLRKLVLDADLRQPTEAARLPQSQAERRVSRLRAPLTVAAARLRASPGRALLVVVGIAASQAMLVAVIGGSLVARDRA